MPTYEYQCDACGHQMEIFQKMSDEPIKECPKCKQPALNKLVSAAQFQLKGSGWYKTDYRPKSASESQSQSQSSEGDKASEAPAKDKTSTDSSNNGEAG